ncbi:hypothetical protein ACIBQX_07685 [Nonomuraea sp. NPDC049714]|uniref:hypothetical protein n=1 Tax=Nonomuraea sp. NPDC049714 TaxID=3364357 RepID=UPI0037A638AB
MSDKPEATQGLGGESDVVAERSGATTEKGRRPIPADPPEAADEADAERDEENEEDEVTRPDAGPTA